MQSQFERDELQAPLSEINMTPLVDVMLVLLVIFLITAPILNSVIELNLPNEAASEISDNKPFVVSIDKNGKYFIDEKAVEFSDLENELQIIAKKNPKQQIHLRADVEVSYGKVSNLLALSQKLGLTNIGFITNNKN
jgi:biopolymer transport protein TolR